MNSKKIKNNIIKTVLSYEQIYLIITILMSSLLTGVFFGMTLNIDGCYPSDTPAHIREGLSLNGYGLQHIFVFLVGKVTSFPMLQLIVAIFETVLVMATWILSQKYIKDFFDLDKYIVLAISTGLIFLTSIYIPVIFPDFYKEGLGTQPWHNSTYYGMRLAGVVYFTLLSRVLPRYQKCITKSEWCGITLSLAVSTMFKPNFLLSVCVVLASILIFDLFRERNIQVFKNIVVMGMTIIPSIIVLLIQYIVIYILGNPEGNSGIEIVWFSDLMWQGGAMHMFIKLFRQFAFMLVVLLFVYREKKEYVKNLNTNINMYFSIMLYVSSLIIFSVFKETGTRANDGNFGWAIPMGYYLMYLYIVPWFIQKYNVYRVIRKISFKGSNCFFYRIGIILLLAHLVSGICYFTIIALGKTFFL